jgi:hypothetical protein
MLQVFWFHAARCAIQNGFPQTTQFRRFLQSLILCGLGWAFRQASPERRMSSLRHGLLLQTFLFHLPRPPPTVNRLPQTRQTRS